MPNYVSLDTETDLIGPGNLAPDIICASFYDLAEREAALLGHLDDDLKPTLHALLSDPDTHIIGHNIAYDLSVIARYDETLLEPIWDALYDNRVHDTMLREMLINLTTTGNIDIIEDGGMNRKISYALGSLVKDYLGINITADKEAADSARMTYSIVKGTPVSEWPENYVTYAKDDARYTGLVFLEQEARRNKIMEETGLDPFKQATFRTRTHFALRLLECQGNRLDPDKVRAVTKEFEDLYNARELVQPLVEAGIVIPAMPPQPFAKGTKEHLPECRGHSTHPDYKKGKKVECTCPVKMKAATEERTSIVTLHERIWGLALAGKCEAWASKSTLDMLRRDGIKDDYIDGQTIKADLVKSALYDQALEKGMPLESAALAMTSLPDKWKLKTSKEWLANFADSDPVIAKYAERKKLEKIVTSYLPGMYAEVPGIEPVEGDKYANKAPAERIHACFSPLKRTGRTSSYASKLYPSWNGQQVDPRIRPCVIPEPGRALMSIDYASMELVTAAQVCLNLFGYSVLADKINSGTDVHAYLGAQIAYALDEDFKAAVDEYGGGKDIAYDVFKQLKGFKEPCTSPLFATIKEGGTWDDFFGHYRKFAKPTGLGYPGGLGPKTFVAYAKATYGVTVDLATAELLRNVWKDTYPELGQYLDYVNKECWDRLNEPELKEDDEGKFVKRTFYAYDTPLGLHRAKCDYCACANGQALQSISADGALTALAAVVRECSIGSLKGKVFPSLFIHDELFGEVLQDGHEHEYVQAVADIMEREFKIVVPDVKIGTEACMMYRWSKSAKPVYDEAGRLVPWVPKETEAEAVEAVEEIEIEELTGED